MQQRRVAAGGHQQQVAELARRAFAAPRGGDPVRGRARLGMAVGRRASEARARHQRQVGPVVADHRHVGPLELQRVEQGLRGRQLVARAVAGVREPQVGDAPAQRRAVAAADDQRRDAGLRQQLQAMAIEHVKGLDPLAGVVDEQAPVGEHAIDIEDRRLHAEAAALRLEQKLGRKAQR